MELSIKGQEALEWFLVKIVSLRLLYLSCSFHAGALGISFECLDLAFRNYLITFPQRRCLHFL